MFSPHLPQAPHRFPDWGEKARQTIEVRNGLGNVKSTMIAFARAGQLGVAPVLLAQKFICSTGMSFLSQDRLWNDL
jgi:hypothetical protein